jgi:NAD-dependent SIR2 family protein deacetylase
MHFLNTITIALHKLHDMKRLVTQNIDGLSSLVPASFIFVLHI